MIEFFFDCSSPWTYIAFRNLQSLAAELKESIIWRPVLVGGIFNSANKGIYIAREDMNSPKNRYMLKVILPLFSVLLKPPLCGLPVLLLGRCPALLKRHRADIA